MLLDVLPRLAVDHKEHRPLTNSELVSDLLVSHRAGQRSDLPDGIVGQLGGTRALAANNTVRLSNEPWERV